MHGSINQAHAMPMLPIIGDVQGLSGDFRSCTFNWVSREANTAAHEL